jgi:hypothetical protein
MFLDSESSSTDDHHSRKDSRKRLSKGPVIDIAELTTLSLSLQLPPKVLEGRSILQSPIISKLSFNHSFFEDDIIDNDDMEYDERLSPGQGPDRYVCYLS